MKGMKSRQGFWNIMAVIEYLIEYSELI